MTIFHVSYEFSGPLTQTITVEAKTFTEAKRLAAKIAKQIGGGARYTGCKAEEPASTYDTH